MQIDHNNVCTGVFYAELTLLRTKMKDITAVVNEQSNDAGLWFTPVYITEDHLQRALRELHAAVEAP